MPDFYSIDHTVTAMRFTIKQLEVFLAVARFENISTASTALHLSQSATSEALLNFERAYDVQLFDRSRNKLSLNAKGQSIRKAAVALLDNCQNFEQLLETHEQLGHIKVGASFTIGNHLATRYLAHYLEAFPEADVQLDIANTPDVVSKVLNYDVDIGMIEGEVQHRELALIPWREDELVVFCAAKHPLANKQSLSRKDIKQANWILREPDSGARHTFEHALADLLPEITIHMEFKHNEAIKNAVESGLGIGCLSRIVLQKNFDNGDLVPLKLPRTDMRRTFYFALPKSRAKSAATEAWMQSCQALS